jgi:hypothetical protein
MEVQSSNPLLDVIQNLTQFADSTQDSQPLQAKKVLELAATAVDLFNDYEISKPVSSIASIK